MESSVTSSTTTIAVPTRKRQVANTNDSVIPIGYKRCGHCGKIKPLDEFYNNKSQPDGKRCECKECTKEAQTKARKKKTEPDLPFDYARRINRAQALSFAPETKECHQCHKTKPMTEFSTNNRHPDHLENICKKCMSENRREKKQKKTKSMKQQTTITQNTQTFEYLAIGTRLYYIHDNVALDAPIRNINIDIANSGALISYIVPTGKPTEEHKIYANEIGSTVFTNPLDLITYFFKKQDMKYNVIKK